MIVPLPHGSLTASQPLPRWRTHHRCYALLALGCGLAGYDAALRAIGDYEQGAGGQRRKRLAWSHVALTTLSVAAGKRVAWMHG